MKLSISRHYGLLQMQFQYRTGYRAEIQDAAVRGQVEAPRPFCQRPRPRPPRGSGQSRRRRRTRSGGGWPDGPT